jgi:hypothetical protein
MTRLEWGVWLWGGLTLSLTIAILAFVFSGGLKLLQPAEQGQPSQALRPTASEVFKLRSECVALGDSLLEANVIGPALAHEALSHYDPNTNRCYIEITVHTADLSAKNPYYGTYLYDGQTREMLASFTTKNGEKSGLVFGVLPDKPTDDNGFSFTVEYIRSKMDDDRKQ